MLSHHYETQAKNNLKTIEIQRNTVMWKKKTKNVFHFALRCFENEALHKQCFSPSTICSIYPILCFLSSCNSCFLREIWTITMVWIVTYSKEFWSNGTLFFHFSFSILFRSLMHASMALSKIWQTLCFCPSWLPEIFGKNIVIVFTIIGAFGHSKRGIRSCCRDEYTNSILPIITLESNTEKFCSWGMASARRPESLFRTFRRIVAE